MTSALPQHPGQGGLGVVARCPRWSPETRRCRNHREPRGPDDSGSRDPAGTRSAHPPGADRSHRRPTRSSRATSRRARRCHGRARTIGPRTPHAGTHAALCPVSGSTPRPRVCPSRRGGGRPAMTNARTPGGGQVQVVTPPYGDRASRAHRRSRTEAQHQESWRQHHEAPATQRAPPAQPPRTHRNRVAAYRQPHQPHLTALTRTIQPSPTPPSRSTSTVGAGANRVKWPTSRYGHRWRSCAQLVRRAQRLVENANPNRPPWWLRRPHPAVRRSTRPHAATGQSQSVHDVLARAAGRLGSSS